MEKSKLVESKKNEKEGKLSNKISEKVIEKLKSKDQDSADKIKLTDKNKKINLENEVLVEKLNWFYQKKKNQNEKKGEEKQDRTNPKDKKEQKIPEKEIKKEEKREEKAPEKKIERKLGRAPPRFIDDSSEFHTEFEPTKADASAPVLKPQETKEEKPRNMEQVLSTVPSERKEEKKESGNLYDNISDPKYYREAYSDPSELYENKNVGRTEERVLQETVANIRPTRVRRIEEQMPQETRGGTMREGIKYELTRQEDKHSPGFVPEFTKYNKEKRKKL